MTPQSIAFFAAGLILLLVGAELMVRGASRLAAAFGVSALVVGLTIVAYGTGSPEFAVGVRAALAGESDLAVGNVVGSNIFNILFILGLSALVRPLIVHAQLIRLDVPVMILASGLLYFLALDGRIDRLNGALLLFCMIAYTGLQIRIGTRQRAAQRDHNAARRRLSVPRIAWQCCMIIAGLGMLVVGSGWLVDGAVELATTLGVDQLVIGLTIVAAGTSLPEAATSLIAGLRGERDIAVGNVVGSNISNIFGVLGAAALVSPHGLTVAFKAGNFDIPVMAVVAVGCLPLFFARGRIGRPEGFLLLAYWVGYTAYVVHMATRHPNVLELRHGITAFVLPLVALTMIVVMAQGRDRRGDSESDDTSG